MIKKILCFSLRENCLTYTLLATATGGMTTNTFSKHSIGYDVKMCAHSNSWTHGFATCRTQNFRRRALLWHPSNPFRQQILSFPNGNGSVLLQATVLSFPLGSPGHSHAPKETVITMSPSFSLSPFLYWNTVTISNMDYTKPKFKVSKW